MSDDESYKDEEVSDREAQEDSFSRPNPSSLLLNLAADMFRQHSDLFLQQAAILERISASPTNPESWDITEASPESVQASIHQEQLSTLVIKSYESMCQVQKRVDFLEQLMIINGVGTTIIPNPSKRPLVTKKGRKTPIFFFSQKHEERLANEFGRENARGELLKLWTSMNPAQRRPYILKAQEMASKRPAHTNKTKSQNENNESDDTEHSMHRVTTKPSKLRVESVDTSVQLNTSNPANMSIGSSDDSDE